MLGENCELRIELARPKHTYEPGTPIRGSVQVDAKTDCQCNALILTLEWYTHGRGDTTQQCVDRQVLFEDEWDGGRYYTYDFEVELPPGPYTYHGKYLNVDWRLQAEADIAWSTARPAAEQKLILEPSGNEQSFRTVGDRREDAMVSTSGSQPVSFKGLLLGIPCLALGLIFLPIALVGEDGGTWLFALGMIGVGGYILFRAIRNALAEQRLGDVDIHLSTTAPNPGETLQCRVALAPSGTVDLNKITVLLRGYEHVVSESGTEEERTHTHTVHAERKTLPGSEQATLRGEHSTFETEVTLPDSAPFSVYADDNELRWEVEVKVDVLNWTAWSHTEPLTVRPGAG